MALRPLRNTTITFGLVAIPVRLYTATRQEDISFNLLHQPCGSRVNRKWWCPEHQMMIESDELIRAYQISRGRYVTFTDEEIEALESDENRALDITEFVALDQIDPVYFDRAYFLGPAPGGDKTYMLLSTSMKKQNKVALARWVSGSREHLVILRPYQNGLILHTMYYADEVRDFGEVDLPASEPRDKEVKLAEMLIDELTEKKFDPLRYKDEYRQRVLDRIEAKARGEEIITSGAAEEKAAEVVDIMEALRRSLEGARPSAKRAAAKPATARAESRKPAKQAKSRRKAS